MQNTLQNLCRQFLSGYPINHDSYPEALNLDEQQCLINSTVNSELVLKYPLKIDYQKAFLKTLLQKLEKEGNEVFEEIYSAYARLVAVSEDNSEYFKHYQIGNEGPVITLKENINLISEGTTGLRTWQASLALAEWCIINRNLLVNKHILELGSGVGLTGLVTSLKCQPKSFKFTDCHNSVLKTLCGNIAFNCKQIEVNLSDNNNRLLQSHLSGVNVTVLNLPWEKVDEHIFNQIGNIDVILAADIVYDSDLFGHLIAALKHIAVNCGVQRIVFACTERNADTLKTFLDHVGHYFSIYEDKCPTGRYFFWCPDPPVRIFQFKLKELSG